MRSSTIQQLKRGAGILCMMIGAAGFSIPSIAFAAEPKTADRVQPSASADGFSGLDNPLSLDDPLVALTSIGACCLLGSDPSDFAPCENLSQSECESINGLFQFDKTCGVGDQFCPIGACIGRETSCDEKEPTFCVGGQRDGLLCNFFAFPSECATNFAIGNFCGGNCVGGSRDGELCDPLDFFTTDCDGTQCPGGQCGGQCPDGDCQSAFCRGNIGCEHPRCCTEVCLLPNFFFCCEIHWTSLCADKAIEICVLEVGACCAGDSCSIATEIDCSDMGGVFFGVDSVCDTPDSDGDGRRDECDGCPDDPNKTDPGFCGCFAPETDTDGDDVPDCVDGCPDDPNKSEPGVCGCGMPDDDTDGDNVEDCIDGCPNDPNKTEPGVCGCGVPDIDTDGDDVEDCIDDCPEDANKTEPGVCGCGVPDVDTDGDNLEDCLDGCPNDSAKTEPGVCGCGVPDIDTDGDDVEDCIDGCPEDTNKTEPGVCGCGVPDVDTDGDNLEDCLDGCPNDSAKTEPGVCGCGIDDSVDSDGDTVPDCLDLCPELDDTVFAPDCDDSIPTVSEWGMIVITLSLLTASKILFTRKRRRI